MLNVNENRLQLSARTGLLLMAAITVARGTSYLFSKALLGSMEPLNLLGVRFLLAFLILFLLFFRRIINTVKENPGILLGALLLGGTYFVCMAAELIGLQYTTASTCSFLENSAIVMVPLIEAILLRRAPKPVVLVSTIVTFIGIGLIVLMGSAGGDAGVSAEAAQTIGEAAGSTSAVGTGAAGTSTAPDAAIATGVAAGFHISGIGIGELLCMVAALTFAFAIIITDRLSKKYEPMTLGILYVGFMGAMGMIASFLVETPHLPESGSQWLLLLGLAVICSAFGFTLQPTAQKPLSAETSGILFALNPLTTAILGWVLLGEALGTAGIIGAILILGGILLPNLRPGRRQSVKPATKTAPLR